jgi:hypothetical protein
MDPGCARATDDTSGRQLPLETRYPAGSAFRWLPPHAGASGQRGTRALADDDRGQF